MKIKSDRIKNPNVRNRLIAIKLTELELEQLKELANLLSNGNISLLMRELLRKELKNVLE